MTPDQLDEFNALCTKITIAIGIAGAASVLLAAGIFAWFWLARYVAAACVV